MQVPAYPAGAEIIIRTATHEPDITSTEVGSVIIRIGYTLNDGHAAAVIHVLHADEVRMKPDLVCIGKRAVQVDHASDAISGRNSDVRPAAVVQVVLLNRNEGIEPVISSMHLQDDENLVIRALARQSHEWRVFAHYANRYMVERK